MMIFSFHEAVELLLLWSIDILFELFAHDLREWMVADSKILCEALVP